jgi:hypothetical protein
MLDHAFGMFNNVPTVFQWAEIDLPFPSDDHFFKIADYDEMIAQKAHPKRSMKIKDAFMRLFASPASAEQDLAILRQGALSALDMQMLIHCLFSLFKIITAYTNMNSYLYPCLAVYILESNSSITRDQHPPSRRAL